MTIPLLQTFVERSKTTPLEILLEDLGPETKAFVAILRSEAVGRRVKTLYTQVYSAISNLLPFFPSLENVFCDSPYMDHITFDQLCNRFHLKALQISLPYYDNLELIGQLRELRWLNISHALTPFFSLLKALGTLPNLQVLHFSTDNDDDVEFEASSNLNNPTITLHELKVLITKQSCSILSFIDAPKLSYLDAVVESKDDDCGRFGGFDFSWTTHIHAVLDGDVDEDEDFFILGVTGSEDMSKCFSFNRTCEATGSIFDEIPTLYPNQFRISTNEDKHFRNPPGFFENLTDFIVTGHFRELRWLDLKFSDSISLLSLIKALDALPSLQILKLCLGSARYPNALTIPDSDESDFTNPPTVALHELKVLIIEECPILHFINAPKLSYLDITVYPEDENYGHFAGFDFSPITHTCITLDVNECPFIMGKNGSTHSEDVIFHLPFNKSVEAFGSVFDEIPIFFSNQFYISFEKSYFKNTPNTPITACLEKSINLVELVMNKFVAEDGSVEFENCEMFSSFFKSLIGKESISSFTVFSGNNFNAFCNFFSNSRICPNLERLSYCDNNNEERLTSSDLYTCLSRLMEERTAARSTPLEVEMAGFDFIRSSSVLEQIETLGLRLIQKKRKRTPIFFEKEQYFNGQCG